MTTVRHSAHVRHLLVIKVICKAARAKSSKLAVEAMQLSYKARTVTRVLDHSIILLTERSGRANECASLANSDVSAFAVVSVVAFGQHL